MEYGLESEDDHPYSEILMPVVSPVFNNVRLDALNYLKIIQAYLPENETCKYDSDKVSASISSFAHVKVGDCRTPWPRNCGHQRASQVERRPAPTTNGNAIISQETYVLFVSSHCVDFSER